MRERFVGLAFIVQRLEDFAMRVEYLASECRRDERSPQAGLASPGVRKMRLTLQPHHAERTCGDGVFDWNGRRRTDLGGQSLQFRFGISDERLVPRVNDVGLVPPACRH